MTRTVAEVVGSMRQEDGTGAVRAESWFDTTPEDLWEAVTTPERLARWLGEFGGDLQVGGTFTASFTSTWTGFGRVEVCDAPHRLLVATWEEDDHENQIEAVLIPEDDGVRLVVENRGLSPQALPAHGAGWQVHVEDLHRYLDGQERLAWRDRWQQLIGDYRDRTVA